MKLKQYIDSNGLTVTQISKEAGIPYSTISELINGKKSVGKCNAETVYCLAKYFNTTMEELLVCESAENYKNKYELNEKQCLFLAKKKWDENVYCGMKMESRAVTFPETKTILEGINVPKVSLDDIMAIRNMRDAWQFIINNPSYRLDFDYICKLNGFIARNESIEWGTLRNGNVGISGTSYKPTIPVREEVEGSVMRILSSYCTITERALDLFCYITYNQLFWDGNKRTALTAANKLLLDGGCGMITIKDENMQQFNVQLFNMYQTGEKKPLKDFLYNHAVIGIDFS